MHTLLFFAVALVLPVSSYADSHKGQRVRRHLSALGEKGLVEREKYNDADLTKSWMGYWKKEDCQQIRGASGLFLYIAGQLIEESSEFRDQGKNKQADELFEGALKLSEIARNYAINFQSYCKP